MQDLIHQPQVTYCEFKPKSYIIRQGEVLDAVYYLVGGTCYHTSYTVGGTEIINSIRRPENNVHAILGITMIYAQGRISMGNFVAKTPCFCYKIPYQLMMDYVCTHPVLADELLHIFAHKVASYNNRYQERHEGQAPNALCALLLANSQIQGDWLIVDELLTNAHIGRTLGIHKVTVARIIKALKEQNLLTRQGKQLMILEPEQIQRYADGEKLSYGK